MKEKPSDFLNIHLFVLQVWGFWAPKNKIIAKIYKFYTAFAFAAYVTCIPTAAIVYFLTKESLIITDVTESAYLLAEITAYIFRMLVWMKNDKLVRLTIGTLNEPAFNSQKPEQNIFLEKAARKAKRLYIVYQCVCVGALTAWASVPLFSEKRILPLEVWYPFYSIENTTAYILVYLHIYICVASCTFVNITSDMVIAGLMMYATGQLQVLKDSFEQLSTYAKDLQNENKSLSSSEIDNLLYKKIVERIHHHEAITEFVVNIEESFNMFVLPQFMAGSCIICTTAFELSITSATEFKFYWMLSYLICMLIEILIYCWFGTELNYESTNVIDAVYTSSWYTYGPKSKKALFILMERSKRPLTVRAAKLFDLSLASFTKILRGAYSLFAVLQHLLHKNS